MRKLLAIFALSSMFFACGSQDSDPSPAELENDTMYNISPFDTLVAEFTSSIADVDKLVEGVNIIISKNVEWVREDSLVNKFKFIGKNRTPKGTPFFNEMTDSIVFKNLKNAVVHATLKFSTIGVIGDIDYKNSDENSAKDLTNFFSSSKSTIEFAGVLDHKVSTSQINFEDYYKLNMGVLDTLKIVIDARDISTIKIQLTEPGKGNLYKTFAPKKKNDEFKYIVNKDHFDDLNSEVPFYIKVFDNAGINDPSNPYTLTVSRLR